jgi:hypothetical protein
MQSKSRCYNPFKKAAEAKRYWSKSGLNLGRKKAMIRILFQQALAHIGKNTSRQQGCQIFLNKTYQNGKYHTKWQQNIPNGRTIFALAIKYIDIFLLTFQGPRKFTQNGCYIPAFRFLWSVTFGDDERFGALAGASVLAVE